MRDNSFYLQCAYTILEQLSTIKVKTRDELLEYFEEIEQNYINNLEIMLYEMFDDYCTENNLEWEEED